jgi:hypothetical protein
VRHLKKVPRRKVPQRLGTLCGTTTPIGVWGAAPQQIICGAAVPQNRRPPTFRTHPERGGSANIKRKASNMTYAAKKI